ncbi:MAG: hypothetical protein R3E96_07060 [Planctomycetota bacterium]
MYRYTVNGGWRTLPILDAAPNAHAYRVDSNAAGTVVVGYQQGVSLKKRAFVWREGTGTIEIVNPLGPLGNCVATSCSEDGGVVFGSCVGPGGRHFAYRWTASGGAEVLHLMGTNASEFVLGSRDGNALVGELFPPFQAEQLYRWQRGEGGSDRGTALRSPARRVWPGESTSKAATASRTTY